MTDKLPENGGRLGKIKNDLIENVTKEVDKFSGETSELLKVSIDISERRKALAGYTWMTDEQKGMIEITPECIVIKGIAKFALNDDPDIPFREAKNNGIPNSYHWRELIKTILGGGKHLQHYQFFREVLNMKKEVYWLADNIMSSNVSMVFCIKEEPRIEDITIDGHVIYTCSEELNKNPFASERAGKNSGVRRMLES